VIRGAAVALALGLAGTVGCAENQHADFAFLDRGQRSAGPGVLVRWAMDVVPLGVGPYVPVEQAAPGLDVRAGRVYVGSTRGVLWSLTTAGKRLFHYDAGAAIEAQPLVDSERGEVYVSTVRGSVAALRSADLSVRFKVEVNAAISQAGLLNRDTLYLVTDTDLVLALAREDGSVLWRYRREPHEGFAIAGHAGLTLAGTKLLAAFGDGSVVALDAGDGRVLWSVDTSADIEELDSRHFVDVDTTPVVVGDVVYVASFSAGLFGLELASGAVRAHEPALKGVIGLVATPDVLIASSAERGVVCLELPDLALRWQRKLERGAPGRAEVRADGVYVAESLGALLTLALADGHEIGRLETGHGVTAPPVIDGRQGFVLSNAGRLYAFTY